MTQEDGNSDDLRTIREKATTLIAQPGNDFDALTKGVDLLKRAEEIEDLRRKGVGMRTVGLVKELAPWAAVLATLFGLFYQAKQNRDEKADAKWEQVFTAVANGTAGPADVIVFNKFIGSKDHREDARFAAKQFLGSGGQNSEVFERVFSAIYSDARSEYFEDWREIDRSLVDTYNSAPQKQPIINSELAWITTKMGPAIRLRSGTEMDLSHVTLYDGDLAGVDLSKANLWAFEPERMNMRDAILNVNGSSYIASKWSHTAWWQAKSISKNFLAELELAAHFDQSYLTNTGYGAGVRTSKDEYCSDTDALGLHDENTCGHNGQK